MQPSESPEPGTGLRVQQKGMKVIGSSISESNIEELPNGQFKFTFSNGSYYVGAMVDGVFHGPGEITFPNRGRIIGRWEYGQVIEKQFVFEDDLSYKEEGWDYLSHGMDNKFCSEINETVDTNHNGPVLTNDGVLPEDHPLQATMKFRLSEISQIKDRK
ncbi:hypothetical protein PCE1_000066 [Barthelona sp. PCE]